MSGSTKRAEGPNVPSSRARIGSFQRTIALPVSVQGDKAEASYKAGVLELVLPKAERVKAREITVESKD